MGPQALQFNATGKLWFTALSGGRIGRLDPTTGATQSWAVPSPAAGIRPYPFGLTVTTHRQVWFSYLTGGAVGEMNPATGHVALYHLASTQAEVFSLATDARGRIWFTEIIPGILGMIDPTTGKVTEIPVPSLQGRPAALYSIVVTHSNDIWFVMNPSPEGRGLQLGTPYCNRHHDRCPGDIDGGVDVSIHRMSAGLTTEMSLTLAVRFCTVSAHATRTRCVARINRVQWDARESGLVGKEGTELSK